MENQPQPKSIEGLIIDLQNTNDPYVRVAVAERLGEQGADNKKVLDILRNTAQSDSNKDVRDAAYNALIQLEGKNVVSEENPPIIAAENQTKKWTRTGFWAGIIPGFILVLIFPNGNLFFLFCVGYLLGVPGALLGAYIGRQNDTTAWIGAIIGEILGLALFFGFASATCLFCQ